MRRRLPPLIAGILLICAACLAALAFAPRTGAPARPLTLAAALEAPVRELALAVGAAEPPAWDDSPAKLDARTKASGCAINGPYPDPLCTPGAVFATTTANTICKAGYTKTVRSVSTSLKKKVYAQYGIAYPQPTGSYEADHVVPLELGGNNDIANLFPEAATPAPGFREKDLVENYLHQQVCDGAMPLPRAQESIARDWVAVYRSLSASEIAALRAQYQSWADKN